jgi:hypothetical protein
VESDQAVEAFKRDALKRMSPSDSVNYGKFCLQSPGSREELLDDLNVCEDESYLPPIEVAPLKQHGWRIHQLLNGYIRWLREQKRGASLALREDSVAYGLTDDKIDEILRASHPLQRFSPSTLQPK